MKDSSSGKPASRNVNWNDTRAFLAVARNGTLSKAASTLGVSIATLARRIERLESAMNIPLFVRHQLGYQLTDEGLGLIPKAKALETAANAFISGADSQQRMTGSIKLATTENLALYLILPALREFREKHPGLVVKLVTDISTVNLHRRDADLAIRLVKPERGNVSLRRLGTLGYGLYASAEYVSQRKATSDPGDYDKDDFITWDERYSYLPSAQWVKHILQGRKPSLTTTSLSCQIIAAEEGLGLAALPHFLARDTRLVCIEPDIDVSQTIYLVIQSDLARSRRIRAVADFLSELVINNSGPLSGP